MEWGREHHSSELEKGKNETFLQGGCLGLPLPRRALCRLRPAMSRELHCTPARVLGRVPAWGPAKDWCRVLPGRSEDSGLFSAHLPPQVAGPLAPPDDSCPLLTKRPFACWNLLLSPTNSSRQSKSWDPQGITIHLSRLQVFLFFFFKWQ